LRHGLREIRRLYFKEEIPWTAVRKKILKDAIALMSPVTARGSAVNV
jgi:hypothetical protein